jgi:hypothetical protein
MPSQMQLQLLPDFGGCISPGRPYCLRAMAVRPIAVELPPPDRGVSVAAILQRFSCEPASGVIPQRPPMITIECLTILPPDRVAQKILEKLAGDGLIIVSDYNRRYQTKSGEWVIPCMVDPTMLGLDFSAMDLDNIAAAQRKRDRKAKRMEDAKK